MPLTDVQCRAAGAREKEYKLSDAGGLHLLVKPNGSRLWRWAYRFNKQQKTLSLGAYPEVKLVRARLLCEVAREKLKAGIDPSKQKVRERKAAAASPRGRTFLDVATEHHNQWKVGKTVGHVMRTWNRLLRDIVPEIGHLAMKDIRPADIIAMIRKVEDRGAINISKRLKQRVSEVFAFAIAHEIVDTDPTAHVGRALKEAPRVQHLAKISSAELPALLVAIDRYDREMLAREALKFTMLTATRTNEVRFMTWAEIQGDEWRIPAGRMKMQREHIVPLSTQAKAILAGMPKTGDYVFGGMSRKPMSQNTMLYALYRMGYRGRQTVHGFRGLFSTILNEREYNRDWIEIQLAHADDDGVRSAYNAALYMKQRAKMMQDWADYLDAARLKAQKVEPVDDFGELLI